MFPNIFSMVSGLIGTQEFTWLRFSTRTTNEIGLDVTNTYPPLKVRGVVQPLQNDLREQYGIEFNVRSIIVYMPYNVLDIERDISGDRIIYRDLTYQVRNVTDWYHQNGWVSFIAVEINV